MNKEERKEYNRQYKLKHKEYFKEYYKSHYVKRIKMRIGNLPEGYIWKEITGTDGWYYVSTEGMIYSFKMGKTLKPTVCNNGYYAVVINRKRYYVHRLVANAFIPNPENLRCVNHKNCIKTDNRVENLEWCTDKYNINYADAQEKRIKSLIENKGYLKFRNNKLSKPVIQYDLEGNVVKEWCSIREAYRQFSFNPTSISRCCKGKYKTACGYIWKYKE